MARTYARNVSNGPVKLPSPYSGILGQGDVAVLPHDISTTVANLGGHELTAGVLDFSVASDNTPLTTHAGEQVFEAVVHNRTPSVAQPPFTPIKDGLLPLAATDPATVVWPAGLGGGSISPGGSLHVTYSYVSDADLATVLTLVRAGQINFPGSATVPPGFPTGTYVYCLNGEELIGASEGTVVYSIADSVPRTFNGQSWVSDGYDSWKTTTYAGKGRHGYALVVLPSGEVLIVGGTNAAGGVTSTIPAGKTNAGQLGATCHRYNPATGALVESCPLPSNNAVFTLGVRVLPGAALLPNGKVLAGGGANFAIGVPDFFQDPAATFKDFWLYDPSTDNWTAAADCIETAFCTIPLVTLGDGRVLLAGESSPSTLTWPSGGAATTLEKFRFPMSLHSFTYNYLTNAWTQHGNLTARRVFGRPVLMSDGRVFLGGGSYDFQSRGMSTPPTCEMFNPVTNTWAATAVMPLIDGEDKMAPATFAGLAINSIQRTAGGSPITGLAGPNMNVRVNTHVGTQYYVGGTITIAGATNALNNGTFDVMMVVNDSTGFCRIYYYNEPGVAQAGAAGTASVSEMANGRRYEPFVAALPGNKVLVAGGNRPPNAADCRTAACLQTGGVFTNLQTNNETMRKSSIVYDPATNTWARVGDMWLARNSCNGAMLPNGNILVVNGRTFNQASFAACEVFNVGTLQWTDAALLDPRRDANGDFVLFLGGTGNPSNGTSPAPGFILSNQESEYRYLLGPSQNVPQDLVVAVFGAIVDPNPSNDISIYREGIPSLGHHLNYL